MNKYFYIFCFIFSISAIQAQNSDKIHTLSPKQMKKDVLFFYEKLLKTHPNPYQVLSPEKLDIKIQELLDSLNKPLNRREFSLKITTLNAYFDGHTQIQPAAEVYKHAEKGLLLPEYAIEIKNDAFFFAQNHPYIDSSLYGKKIIKINNGSCSTKYAIK
jgi:hypothetical protein